MSKKSTSTKTEKPAVLSSMTELEDEQLDAVQGGVVTSPAPSFEPAATFFEADKEAWSSEGTKTTTSVEVNVTARTSHI